MNNNPNKRHGETQMQQILEFLLSGCSLTVLDALRYFKCLSCSQRISNLNAMGWGIKKRMIKVDSGKFVAEYYL